jgi:peroxiredoxin
VRRSATALAACALLAAGFGPPRPQEGAVTLPMPVPCKIDALLESPGGSIEFQLEVRAPRPKLTTPTFALRNGARGEDLVWIERWETPPGGLVLHVDSYDSHLEITGRDAGGVLRGRWRKLRGPNEWAELPFRGTVQPATAAPPPVLDPAPPPIAGRWTVKFSSSDEAAVGVFTHPEPGRVAGTFLTTLGDYRYLAGRWDAALGRWNLSCFDGAHAFLFAAKVEQDGSLAGEFWSGATWHETWKATRDEGAALPDPFGLTRAAEKVDLAKLVFIAQDRSRVSLADPQFAGKARIVQLFGTWCPNCNDEATYLRDLHRRFKNQGLSVVGLAFELSGDEERDLAQLGRFAARHQVEYPLLLAGKSDKQEASKRFPLIDHVRAYPTTVFLRADGSVRAVHQGFSGPATGAEHQKLRQDFERLIAELLR